MKNSKTIELVDVAQLRIKPGDTLVVHSGMRLSLDGFEYLGYYVRQALPGVKVLVLDSSIRDLTLLSLEERQKLLREP
jgi:hypothetical protein